VWILLLGIPALSFYWPPLLWLLLIVLPVAALAHYDAFVSRRSLPRNFPVLGRLRYLMEALRPKIYQYFVESDIDGRPINRVFRSLVYQRSKREIDTVPFGTQFEVYRPGYEWMNHSLAPGDPQSCNCDLRVLVGGPQCERPYDASILNISAMSFGALSRNAILALSGGAELGGFAHNTGEGGISPYHLEGGGDLIWQVGTGYFGCRNADGEFSPEMFREGARLDAVKMIEIKLSQGAKPGHGGILPAVKNSEEIAGIRRVEPGTDVISPPAHSAFGSPLEMMDFIAQLRDLSGGKPIGFKLCVGSRHEFMAICKAMIATGIRPDFITVDGGEGGTGAAPTEYTNSIGTPLREGLALVVDALIGFDLKKDIRVLASGKIFSGFHAIRALALGADMVNSARGMMLALGCIQALECNRNTCPTGVATQDPALYRGLIVSEKRRRVANYHAETVRSIAELLTASGLENPTELKRSSILRRVSNERVRSLEEIFPYPETGCLLRQEPPGWLARDFAAATEKTWRAV